MCARFNNGLVMKKKIILILLLAGSLMLLANCGKTEQTAESDAALAEPLDVPRMKVQMSSVEDFYEATGTVKAKTTTDVAANMMGRITSIRVNEGDTVLRGQTLIEIDNRENQAQFQKATAGLKEARAALVEIDRSVDGANAAVKTDAGKSLLDKVKLRAPLLGNILTIYQFDCHHCPVVSFNKHQPNWMMHLKK